MRKRWENNVPVEEANIVVTLVYAYCSFSFLPLLSILPGDGRLEIFNSRIISCSTFRRQSQQSYTAEVYGTSAISHKRLKWQSLGSSFFNNCFLLFFT